MESNFHYRILWPKAPHAQKACRAFGNSSSLRSYNTNGPYTHVIITWVAPAPKVSESMTYAYNKYKQKSLLTSLVSGACFGAACPTADMHNDIISVYGMGMAA